MFTLSQMRTSLKKRANQVTTESNLVWDDDEFDEYCRDGVYFIIDHGRPELISRSLKFNTGLTLVGSGVFSKPDDYYRFIAAEIDGVQIREIKEFWEQKFIEDNDNTKGDDDRKYLYDYDGDNFLASPSTSSTVKLQYLRELLTTEFISDSHISPLTNVGDRYALQYANGIFLASKLYKADEAKQIFDRVEKYIS